MAFSLRGGAARPFAILALFFVAGLSQPRLAAAATSANDLAAVQAISSSWCAVPPLV